MNQNENNFDFISVIKNIENGGKDELMDFSIVEPRSERDIQPLIFNEEENQSETNDTTIKNEQLLTFLNENHGIELICPYVGRRRLRKYFKIKRRSFERKNKASILLINK